MLTVLYTNNWNTLTFNLYWKKKSNGYVDNKRKVTGNFKINLYNSFHSGHIVESYIVWLCIVLVFNLNVLLDKSNKYNYNMSDWFILRFGHSFYVKVYEPFSVNNGYYYDSLVSVASLKILLLTWSFSTLNYTSLVAWVELLALFHLSKYLTWIHHCYIYLVD